ncbi:hypothetical protein PSPO01_12078 [Paraphaeosphaeria sporulosa]
MLTIRVKEPRWDGISVNEFLVYRGLLCFYSGFFVCALNGSFKEAGSTVYEMHDCKIRTFTISVYWLNTGLLSSGIDGESLQQQDPVDVFIFVDFYAIPAFENGALELMSGQEGFPRTRY